MNETEKRWMVFNYAWKWFEYHASQRLLAFRFYLIIISAMGWLFIQGNIIQLCSNKPLFLGIALSIVSMFFILLELRNNGLVNRGRDALDEIEKELGLIGTPYAIRHNDKSHKNDFVSHSFVIMAIYIVVGVCGLVLFGMSFCK